MKNCMYLGTAALSSKKLFNMDLQLFAGRLNIGSEGGEYIPQPASGAVQSETQNIDEPVQVQEVVEQVEETNVEQDTVDVSNDNTPPAEDKSHHKFAEMRVNNKTLKEELEAAKASLKEYEDKTGKVNKHLNDLHGDKGITDIDSYLSHMSDYEKRQLQQKASTGDTDAMQALMNEQLANNPMMEKINQVSEYLEKQALNNNIKSELTEFNNEYDQKIESYDDIGKLENPDQIYDFMEKGLSVSQAYILANKDSVINNTSKKVKQETINNISGRNHMSANGAGAGSADKVINMKDMPPETLNMYKRLFKGKKTDKQILDHWKKSQK